MAKMHKAYKRVIQGMGEDLEAAAAMFVLLRLPRDEFIQMAGNAYDFLESWHQQLVEEQKEAKADSSLMKKMSTL